VVFLWSASEGGGKKAGSAGIPRQNWGEKKLQKKKATILYGEGITSNRIGEEPQGREIKKEDFIGACTACSHWVGDMGRGLSRREGRGEKRE